MEFVWQGCGTVAPGVAPVRTQQKLPLHFTEPVLSRWGPKENVTPWEAHAGAGFWQGAVVPWRRKPP